MNFSSQLREAMDATEYDEKAMAVVLSTAPRIFFIGNGGSAAIASHMANDFARNGKIPTIAFNDAASLTCISNDETFMHVFSAPLEQHLTEDDTLVCVSSSGRSPNIISAALVAKEKKSNLITFSGFDEDNSLRKMGAINIYVPSHDYGIVETAHLGILHATLREIINAG